MKRIVFSLAALVLALTNLAQEQRLNIVMISIDDLNDWVGVYGGHPQVKTPNIDKLAEKAMVFQNASCPAPVCGPSRSALLSGFMPATTGLYRNAHNMLHSEIVQTNATLPEYFSKNGYVTISSGKIFHKHATENGVDHGHWAFDIWEHETGGGGIQEDKFFSRDDGIINGKKIENPKYTEGGGSSFEFGPTEGGKEVTKDYRTAKWFEQKLQEDYDKPFFMSVGISRPHLPFIVPEEYFDMYSLDTLIVPEYRWDDLDDIVDENGNTVYEPHDDFLWYEHYGIHKETVRAYMAATSYADECAGVVLDALENSKYADNTIVMVWGDHGWHLGEKLQSRKAKLWREATQLPLIVHVPGMDSKQDCYRNVNLIDLYPTLIDLCNLPEKELDGKSFKPLLENPTMQWDPTTLTTMGRGNHSVMSEKWHYIIRNGAEELYNLEEDPMEFVNLANNSSRKVKKVKKYMKSFLPEKNAESIPKYNRNRSAKKIDESIKPKRLLQNLK